MGGFRAASSLWPLLERYPGTRAAPDRDRREGTRLVCSLCIQGRFGPPGTDVLPGFSPRKGPRPRIFSSPRALLRVRAGCDHQLSAEVVAMLQTRSGMEGPVAEVSGRKPNRVRNRAKSLLPLHTPVVHRTLTNFDRQPRD